MRYRILTIMFIISAIIVVARNVVLIPQDNRTRPTRRSNNNPSDNISVQNRPDTAAIPNKKDSIVITSQPILDIDEEIPDSLLNPRWPVQRTSPITYDDLNRQPTDLVRPDNMNLAVEYNDT